MSLLIQPALKYKELIDEFVALLPPTFIPYMFRRHQSSFSQIVLSANKVGDASRNGLIPSTLLNPKPLLRPKLKDTFVQAE